MRPTVSQRLLLALIALLCVVAAAGIVVVIAGDLDKTAAKVIYTALLVPVYFSTAIVQVSLIRRGGGLGGLGRLGIAICAAGFATALFVIWPKAFEDETATRVWGSFLVASVAVATIALLIRRARPVEPTAVRVALLAALAVTFGFAGLLVYAIAVVDGDDDTLARATGVGAVLWALALVAVPLLRQAMPQVETVTASAQKD